MSRALMGRKLQLLSLYPRPIAVGTIVLTAPTGHLYRTEPHGAAMFRALAQPTGELDIAPHVVSPDTDRSAMMPRRKQTRDQDRRDRINAERRERTELIAEEERKRQAWLAANDEPPPSDRGSALAA
jgi:hypothetical protein